MYDFILCILSSIFFTHSGIIMVIKGKTVVHPMTRTNTLDPQSKQSFNVITEISTFFCSNHPLPPSQTICTYVDVYDPKVLVQLKGQTLSCLSKQSCML